MRGSIVVALQRLRALPAYRLPEAVKAEIDNTCSLLDGALRGRPITIPPAPAGASLETLVAHLRRIADGVAERSPFETHRQLGVLIRGLEPRLPGKDGGL